MYHGLSQTIHQRSDQQLEEDYLATGARSRGEPEPQLLILSEPGEPGHSSLNRARLRGCHQQDSSVLLEPVMKSASQPEMYGK